MADQDFPLDLLHALGDGGIRVPSDAVLQARVRSAVQREMITAPSQSGGRRWWQGPRLGWVAPVLSSVVAVAVAAVVIVLLSHHHASIRQTSAPPGSVAARFAVLRRPQTSSDRPAPRVLREVSQQDGGRVRPGLSRRLATPAGTPVYLVVLAPGPITGRTSYAWSPRLGDQVAMVAEVDGRAVISQAIPAKVISRAVDGAVLNLPNRSSPQNTATGTHVFLTPDGVARLRVAEIFDDGRVLGARTAVATHNTAVVSGPIAQAPQSTTRQRKPLALKLVISWYAANGTAIATSNTAAADAAANRQAAQRRQLIRSAERQHYRAPINLLDHFAIFADADRPPLKLRSGLIISRPTIRSLPDVLLQTSGPPSKLDYAQARKITTRRGVTIWVIPGANGLCITASIPSPAGSSEDCSGSQTLAERGGAGASSGHDAYGIVPIGTNTVPQAGHPHISTQPHDGIYAITPRSH